MCWLRDFVSEPVEQESAAPGYVSLNASAAGISRYRKLGARIGDGVRLIGEIDSVNPHLVSIGDYSVIGRDSILLTHCPIKGPRAVTLGRFVYMGFGAIVLPGVTLGDHCIVGAGAVVTKSAPCESVLVGSPARILRSLTAAEKKGLVDMLTEGRAIGWDPARPDMAEQ
jgi:acetyltransferase-like isoleucine patch superfamily enzyme